MAHTATALQGLEFRGYVAEDARLWVPGDPGDTYNVGDPVIIGATGGAAGVIDAVGTNSIPVAVVTGKKVVCSASSTAFPQIGPAEATSPIFGNESQTLVEVMPIVPVGSPIFAGTFVDHKDDTVVSYSAASVYIEETTGHTADDYPNGALVYVYEGPGAGEWNIVDDYDHTGGAVELLLQLHRKFNATLTSSSKIIVVTGEGASDRGVSFFRRTGTKTGTNDFEVDDHANDGLFMVYADARTIGSYLHQLSLPVVPAPLNFLA